MWKRMGISGATKTVASRRKEVCFMVFKVFSQFIVLLLCLSISAAMPDQLSIGKGGGVFRIGGLEFRLAHFTPGYKQYTRQPGDAFFLPSPSMEWPLRFNGTFRTPTGVFKLTESFSKEGAATVRYEGRLDAAQAVASAELFLITTLPATEFAGENLRVNQIPLLLPARPEKPMRIVRNEVTELMIPLNHGTLVISGNNFRIQVADNRSSGRNTFTLRFYPICDQPGKIGNAEFSLAFNYRGINSFPLDLSRAANMDFADETPGDGKGGWTDQGPTNDLRMFQPGLRVFNGIKFQVIDPRKNHGKSCLVLRGENPPTLPDSAAIELPSNVRGASYLYLLHAAGWTKPHSRLGSVEITYPGQLRQREDLTVDIDAGNWWNPENLPNGTVVWRDHNDHAALGLYLTCIKLDRPDPVKILFRHGEGSLWMLVAASLADGAIRRPRPDEALFIVAGEKYVPTRKNPLGNLDTSLRPAMGIWHSKKPRENASACSEPTFADPPAFLLADTRQNLRMNWPEWDIIPYGSIILSGNWPKREGNHLWNSPGKNSTALTGSCTVSKSEVSTSRSTSSHIAPPGPVNCPPFLPSQTPLTGSKLSCLLKRRSIKTGAIMYKICWIM